MSVDTASSSRPAPRSASFAELFTPKLVTVLREGYSFSNLRTDAIAGLTVAIVALPLSMAIAIASGASPAQGLYTAAVGGFIVSMLGGSRFQIGGPAGAFIVLVAATVAQHGMDGLILATFLSGIMLAAIGFLRLGTFIKFIPFPVTVGFTAGIAVIIFASQIKELLGLTVAGEPGPLLEKLPVLWQSLPTLTPAAVALSVATIAIILGLKAFRPHWPGMLDRGRRGRRRHGRASPARRHHRFAVRRHPEHAARSGPSGSLACRRSSRFFPPPCPSPCWAPSNRFSRPSWPMA